MASSPFRRSRACPMLLACALTTLLAACGGGGGSASPQVSSPGGGTVTPPSAVGNLQLVNQGGPNNNGNASNANVLSNYQGFSWTAATAGSNAIDHYKIYRDGTAYATSTTTSYVDSAATDSNFADFSQPATAHAYAVSAVDTQNNEGPKAYPVVYMFDGQTTVDGQNTDLSYGDVLFNYTDSSADPDPGPYDISVKYGTQTGGGGGWQPVTAPPLVPFNDLELGAFSYFTIDIKVTSSQYLSLGLNTSMVSRVPPGDAFPWKEVNVWTYCTPTVNTWETCKIPLADLNVGYGTFTGSIVGTCDSCGYTPPGAATGYGQGTLTVSAKLTGVPVDVAGFVTGGSVPSGTYIIAHGSSIGSDGSGTYTVEGPNLSASTNVASSTMNYQRTSVYKFFFQWDCCTPPVTTIYANNMGFTTN